MKIAGFVAEFNPFHKGHEYLINKIKKEFKPDLLVVAMSPNFVMRGEPAIFSKQERTMDALVNGIDLVLEIPTIYAIQAADIYARCGVEILYRSGVTDLFFGSETCSSLLFEIAKILSSEEYKAIEKKNLKLGLSFNQASKRALIEIDKKYQEYVDNPNDLLAVQYIKAINDLSIPINVHFIKRVETNYYDEIDINKNIQSATAIRELLCNNSNEYMKYLSYSAENRTKHVNKDYFEFLKYRIISSSEYELSQIIGAGDGFYNRLKTAIKHSDYPSFLNALVSKRDRETKVNRVLMAVLLNIKKEDLFSKLSYIHVLGFNKKGSDYLKTMRKSKLPFITTIKRDMNEMLYREIEFSKIYSLPYKNFKEKDEYSPIIYLEN